MARKKFPPLTQSIYSCAQLAAHFGIDSDTIRDCCTTGQIPWCENRRHLWLISKRGAQFLGQWLSRHDDLHAVRLRMREAAAALDKRVLERQPEPSEQDRLTPDQISDIKKRVKRQSLDAVGEMYHRNKSAISLIVRGLRYGSPEEREAAAKFLAERRDMRRKRKAKLTKQRQAMLRRNAKRKAAANKRAHKRKRKTANAR